MTARRPMSSAGLLVADVVGLAEPERGRQHRDRRLHVDAHVAGVDRQVGARRAPGRASSCRRSAGPRRSRTGPGRRSLDVDAAVAQRRPFLSGRAICLEGDDAFQSVGVPPVTTAVRDTAGRG